MTIDEARLEIIHHSNVQFDPSIVKVFLEIMDEEIRPTFKMN